MMVHRAMLLLSAGYIFSCAAAFAAEPQNATTKHPENSHEHRAKLEALSKNKRSPGVLIAPKANRPHPLPNRGGDSVAGRNVPAPAAVTAQSNQTPKGATAIVSSKLESPGSVARSSRLPTANQTAAASDVRHRGANPATIGGPNSKHAEHTAVLSGNRLGRRP